MRTHIFRATAALIATAAAILVAGPAAAQTVTISQGHIDALSFTYDDAANALDINVEDHAAAAVYDPAEVVFDVNDNHQVTLGSTINCVGASGDRIWVLPRLETAGRIWAGWSTQDMALSDFGGRLQLELVNAVTPAGGSVSVYDPASAGVVNVRLSSDSACDPGGTAVTESHHHPQWSFTAPGSYQLTFQVSGTHATDGAVTSAPVTYTFDVGGA
ncbi:choice-of-anchor M domain-containing protein [Glycomyces buryatensis]|uniref:Surface-anchored protein n=1 Tax=Glycomyces buryatensis TaxID=2570927 RepID=A0A4S8QEF0_9ACTN|nr:choice-of-anchor M domain-containing protein [Glycomyces buryatensis]THV42778.1 hypothetical protein FAB82_04460 [Glycomyces buryatensis]